MEVIFSDDEEAENLRRDLYDGTSSKKEEIAMFGMFGLVKKIEKPRENVLSRTLVNLQKEPDFEFAKKFEIKREISGGLPVHVDLEKTNSASQIKCQREQLLKKWEEENREEVESRKSDFPLPTTRKRKSAENILETSSKKRRRSRRIQIEESSSSEEEEEELVPEKS
ncbi:unnamed protein product [Caenorhabditis angaria]|uniref:Uncharacterized protein n=1 Tax=Caenorhabditis angaria TaxID=860376 RepID=A0A9P1I8F4_9PELO|nr:unnamed protein product [Caenorhabditis angaria]